MKPRTLILRSAGTNCDGETAYAFERAGATCTFVHINRLLEKPTMLSEYQLLAFPGGFSYGDDIAAGRILATQIRHHLSDTLRSFVQAGKPIIGICNGFQVLVKTDLLPGSPAGSTDQTATLTDNTCGRFVDRWIHLAPTKSKCIWTKDLGTLDLPIAHGEGRFVPANPKVQKDLWDAGQVALIYARADGQPAGGELPDNPNGSTDDIAGICDPTGLIFGLMPHPERHIEAIQHPAWARRGLTGEGQGLRIFQNAVTHACENG